MERPRNMVLAHRKPAAFVEDGGSGISMDPSGTDLTKVEQVPRVCAKKMHIVFICTCTIALTFPIPTPLFVC